MHSSTEWQTRTASPPTMGFALSGFQFSLRNGMFDWRLLHGIDPDTAVRLTHVQALESCFHTLQHGNLEAEHGLSSKNCIQVFRLLQLCLEYVWHLRDAHLRMMHSYGAAIHAAHSWLAAAQLYLDTGSQFINSCVSAGEISGAALATVDDARHQLEVADKQYNVALDQLEADDQHVRLFHFRKQRSELNWQSLCAVDLEALTAHTQTDVLDKVLHNLVFGSVTTEARDALTAHHFHQLIPLAQAGLDYLLAQAAATGAELERSMSQLQAACGDIPALTSATQQLHTRISDFILEAQHHAAQLTGTGLVPDIDPAALQTSPVSSPITHRPHSPYVTGVRQKSPHGSPYADTAPFASRAPGRLGSIHTGSAGLPVTPYTSTAIHGAAAGGHLPVAWQTGSHTMGVNQAGIPVHVIDLAPSELQARTPDMALRLEALELDTNLERTKWNDMKKMLLDIRDRVTQQTTSSHQIAGEDVGPVSQTPLNSYSFDNLNLVDQGRPPLPLTQPAAAAGRGGGVAGRGRKPKQAPANQQGIGGMSGDLQDVLAGQDYSNVQQLGLQDSKQETRQPSPAGAGRGRLGGRGGHRRTLSVPRSPE